MRGKKWPDFDVKYRPCIPNKYHFVIKYFYNFEARVWKSYHVTVNSPIRMFFTKLTHRWCNFVISMSIRRYEIHPCIDFAITASTIYCDVNWLSNVEEMQAERYEFDVVISALQRPCEFDVVISTLQQRFPYNIHIAQWIELTINVEATLKHRCNFDVVVSTSLQRCVLVVRRCDVATTLCVDWIASDSAHLFSSM